jgi:hypothetical protein
MNLTLFCSGIETKAVIVISLLELEQFFSKKRQSFELNKYFGVAKKSRKKPKEKFV